MIYLNNIYYYVIGKQFNDSNSLITQKHIFMSSLGVNFLTLWLLFKGVRIKKDNRTLTLTNILLLFVVLLLNCFVYLPLVFWPNLNVKGIQHLAVKNLLFYYYIIELCQILTNSNKK